jgi:hypothetical protein
MHNKPHTEHTNNKMTKEQQAVLAANDKLAEVCKDKGYKMTAHIPARESDDDVVIGKGLSAADKILSLYADPPADVVQAAQKYLDSLDVQLRNTEQGAEIAQAYIVADNNGYNRAKTEMQPVDMEGLKLDFYELFTDALSVQLGNTCFTTEPYKVWQWLYDNVTSQHMAPMAAPQWISVDTALPIKDKKSPKVILHNGKASLMGHYFPERFKTIEFDEDLEQQDYPSYVDNDKDKGILFLKKGWYYKLQDVEDIEYWHPIEGVTHWQPVPSAPSAENMVKTNEKPYPDCHKAIGCTCPTQNQAACCPYYNSGYAPTGNKAGGAVKR